MRGGASRAAWGIGDQALSSLTNFGLGVLVARVVSTREFGAFALTFATYAVIINVGNGAISEPFLVRYSDVDVAEWRRGAAAASGAALSLGVATGTLLFFVGWMVGGSLGRAFLALAPALPGLVLQDTWRTLFFARRQGNKALFNDLTWAAALFPALAVITATGHGTVFWLLLAWGGAATVAAATACVQGRTLPRVSDTILWLREQHDLAPRLLAEVMVFSGAQQVTLYAIGAAAGLAVVGGLRGAEMLLGPLYVVIFGIRVMAVPEAIALLKTSTAAMRRALILLAISLGIIGVATGTVASFFPAWLGRAFLGSTWNTARPALIPTALFMAASSASVGALIGLRALAAPKRSLRARICSAPLVIIGGFVGANVGGAQAAASGMAIGMWMGAGCWWWQLEQAIKEHVPILSFPDSPDEPSMLGTIVDIRPAAEGGPY